MKIETREDFINCLNKIMFYGFDYDPDADLAYADLIEFYEENSEIPTKVGNGL